MKFAALLSSVICLTGHWNGCTRSVAYAQNSPVVPMKSQQLPQKKQPLFKTNVYVGSSLDNTLTTHRIHPGDETALDEPDSPDPALLQGLLSPRYLRLTDSSGNSIASTATVQDSALLALFGAEIELLPLQKSGGTMQVGGIARAQQTLPLWNIEGTRKAHSTLDLQASEVIFSAHPSINKSPQNPVVWDQQVSLSALGGHLESWTVGAGVGVDPVKIMINGTQVLLPEDDPARTLSLGLLFSRAWPRTKRLEISLGVAGRFDQNHSTLGGDRSLVHLSADPGFMYKINKRTDVQAGAQLGVEGESAPSGGLLTSTLVNLHTSVMYRITTRYAATAEANGGWRSNSEVTERTWGILAKLTAYL